MHYTSQPSRLFALLLILALGLLLPAAGRPSLAAQQYQNPATISFGTTVTFPEPAALYPSPITVSGLSGSITKVTVTLNQIDHTFPDSVDILLVGPDGKQVLLMADVGGATQIPASARVNLTFADGAPELPDGGPLVSGTYKPTNKIGPDVFPAPAPALSPANGNTSLSIFNLTNPNGEWRLFAVEDAGSTSGSIGGWSLSIETADLSAQVSAAPDTVNAGSPLNYSVTLRNSGTEAVANPTATIGIPAGTTFSSVTAPAGWSCPAPGAGAPSFTCTTAAFASGAAPVIEVSVLVDKALAPGTALARTAAIVSAVPEADAANNSASANTAVATLADLSVVSVDSPENVNAGAEMTVAVAVQNSGPSNAASARVTIPVPANTTFVSLAAADGWSCTAPAAGAAGEVVCTAGVFSTVSANFSLVVKVDSALAGTATVDSSASIASDTTDGVPTNNSGSDTTFVGTATDLGVSVESAPDPVSAAANLLYTIAVTNYGPSNVAGAALATEVRSGTTFVALEAPAGWSCTTPEAGGIGAVSCANPSFGVATATFKLTVRVLSGTPVGTELQHSSSVSSTTTDSVPGNNGAAEATMVTVAADLSVTMEGVGASVKAGTPLAYTLKVNNSGPEPAEAVTLTTLTPQHTIFVSLQAPTGWVCSEPAAGATGSISCTNEALDVTTDQIVLTVQLDKVQVGTQVPFSAAVQSPTEDGNPANNTVSRTSSTTAAFRAFLPIVRR